jgi:hypothetical protein
MASLRFTTVRDLYDAFPTAADDVGVPPSDEHSLAFLQSLVAKGSWNAAVSFCAYLLPRREAVWWGCQSLRHVKPQAAPSEASALEAAEAWVREPEEDVRREALKRGMQGDGQMPATWMALAAGWSGGSIAPPEFGVLPAGPHQTARAVRAGLLIALSQVASEDIPRLLKPCLDGAIALATGSRINA